MQREVEISIMKELLRQIDEKQNVDAGVLYRNSTDVYTCPDIAQQERQLFFRDHPQLLALSGSLPKPGSYLTVDDFGVPVLATRDADGRFRAFLNSCRHRGARVADGSGEASKFMCPFHNWTYANNGKLMGIPMANHFGQIDKSCNGLIELPAVEQGGLLWVHPRADGKIDLESQLGELGAEIASFGLGEWVPKGETALEKRANWKLANDTFGETYHFARLHKDTLANVLIGDVVGYETFGRNHRLVLANRGIEECRGKSESGWNYLETTVTLYYLFPNIQITVGNGTVNLIKLYPDPAHPDNPSRSLTRIIHYFTQEMIDRENASGDESVKVTAENAYEDFADPEAALTLSAVAEIFASTIDQEDYLMGEYQQRSAESGQLKYLTFGRNELPLHNYHTNFRAALGLPPLERIEG